MLPRRQVTSVNRPEPASAARTETLAAECGDGPASAGQPAVSGLVRLGIPRVGNFLSGQRQDVGQPALFETEAEGVLTP